jgi:hypothetical protein
VFQLKAALRAALLSIVLVAAPADADVVQDYRDGLGKLFDAYASNFAKTGNARGAALVEQGRAALAASPDADIAKAFSKVGVADFTPAIVAIEGLTARTGTLKAAGPALSAVSQCDSIPHDAQFRFGALIAYQVADAILAAAGFACQETVAGFNTAAVCIPLAIALQAAKAPFELGEFCAGEEDSALMESISGRLDGVHADVAAARVEILASQTAQTATLQGATTQARDAVLSAALAHRNAIIASQESLAAQLSTQLQASQAALTAEVRSLSCELMRLSATPQGQRASALPQCAMEPGFPYLFSGGAGK